MIEHTLKTVLPIWRLELIMEWIVMSAMTLTLIFGFVLVSYIAGKNLLGLFSLKDEMKVEDLNDDLHMICHTPREKVKKAA